MNIDCIVRKGEHIHKDAPLIFFYELDFFVWDRIKQKRFFEKIKQIQWKETIQMMKNIEKNCSFLLNWPGWNLLFTNIDTCNKKTPLAFDSIIILTDV